MQRRRFLFWISFGLFSLGERLRAAGLDELAAATIDLAADENSPAAGGVSASNSPPSPPTHWRAASNNTWQWYERESLVDGQWKLTGITTPIHKRTGLAHTGPVGYLDESVVPAEIRRPRPTAGEKQLPPEPAVEHAAPPHVLEPGDGQPDAARRAQHGRPPSKWLRSLNAAELRIWLKTIDVPEAGVEGMTYWEHLTRDHAFDPQKIAGLSIGDQALLHAAAHFGY